MASFLTRVGIGALCLGLLTGQATAEVFWTETDTHRIKVKVEDGKVVGRWEFPKRAAAAASSELSESGGGKLRSLCGYGEALSRRTVELGPAGDDARKAVQVISARIGLLNVPKVFEAPIQNAVAALYEGERVIILDPAFLARLVDDTGTPWSIYSILAHELGHHLNGHTVARGGDTKLFEIQADYYSGFALAKLGASLSVTQAAMRSLPDIPGTTHPRRRQRFESVQKGWAQGRNR